MTLLLWLSGCASLAVLSPQKSWPDLDAGLGGAAVSAPVELITDTYGVHHVRAATVADAWFAAGYVHGRDRAFQIDLTRRLAFGGLSEWFGEDAVALDGFTGGLELRARAEKAYAALSERDRAALDAYAAGVNAGAGSLPKPPVEHRALGSSFEPWLPTDSLGVGYLQAWTLTPSVPRKLFAWEQRGKLDASALEALVRFDVNDPPVDPWWDTLRGESTGELTDGFQAFLKNTGKWERPPAGSNAWVVGPERTATGGALLASDPHLVQRTPSLWVPLHLHSDDGLDVAGVTLAGAPAFLVGHNAHLAWGLTNVQADTVDFAVVPRNGEQGVVVEGKPEVMRTVRTSVRLKGRSVPSETRWTSIGPVISEIDADNVLVMRWQALEQPDLALATFLDLSHAASVAEGQESVEHTSAAALNLLLADDSGSIGWSVLGTLPRRRGISGRTPYPGGRADLGWQGTLDRLPAELNPERGYIASANQRPDGGVSRAIASEFDPGWRQQTIHEALSADVAQSGDHARMLQASTYDARSAAVVPDFLDGVDRSHPLSSPCVEVLDAWDFTTGVQSAGALVWWATEQQYVRLALEPTLGEDGLRRYLQVYRPGRSVLDSLKPDYFVNDRIALAEDALERACVEIIATQGPNSADWQWGSVHQLTLGHPFSAASERLAPWSLGPVPLAGSNNTVAAGGHRLDDARADWVQSVRMVVPLNDLDAATLVHPGGPSGHPMHPERDTQLQAWLDHTPVPLLWSPEAVDAAAEHRIVLAP